MNHSQQRQAALDLSFPDDIRTTIATAQTWSERELEALCCGVPPTKYCDLDEVAPEEVRNIVREKIRDAIKSGALYATPGNGNAIYGGLWRIEPANALRWAFNKKFSMLPEWLFSSQLKNLWAKQADEKLAAGRYTIEEAAKAIAAGTNEQEGPMVIKLMDAARTGSLPMHAPGRTVRYSYEIVGHVKECYEEAYWDELNIWIAANEPRMKFKLPAPESEPVTPVAVLMGMQSQESAKGDAAWIVKAQDIAKEYISRHKAQALFPSQADVCGHVENSLRENRTFGSHGKPLSASYIGRNAIQGEWWKQNKP